MIRVDCQRALKRRRGRIEPTLAMVIAAELIERLHVLDLAEAHLLSLLALENGSGIYNLGYGAGYSVHEVVEMARQITGHQIKTENAPRRSGDPPILIGGADRIMSNLGWQPRFSELDSIIESAWRWLEAHPRGYSAN